MALLEVRNLSVKYGSVVAVNDVSLDVDAGSIIGLIGPNGAGKTTLIDALTGFVPSGGTVQLDGRSLTGMPPHRRARAGLARTWQSIELFDDLTVAEIMRLADNGDSFRWRRGSSSTSTTDPKLVLEDLGLEAFDERLPRELSNGQRKLVGLARALIAGPKVILADEPAAGLDTSESQQLGDRLKALVQHGPSILLIDHDMSLVLAVCDYIYAIDFGCLIAEGTPKHIRSDDAVISAYLGSRHKRPEEKERDAVAGS